MRVLVLLLLALVSFSSFASNQPSCAAGSVPNWKNNTVVSGTSYPSTCLNAITGYPDFDSAVQAFAACFPYHTTGPAGYTDNFGSITAFPAVSTTATNSATATMVQSQDSTGTQYAPNSFNFTASCAPVNCTVNDSVIRAYGELVAQHTSSAPSCVAGCRVRDLDIAKDPMSGGSICVEIDGSPGQGACGVGGSNSRWVNTGDVCSPSSSTSSKTGTNGHSNNFTLGGPGNSGGCGTFNGESVCINNPPPPGGCGVTNGGQTFCTAPFQSPPGPQTGPNTGTPAPPDFVVTTTTITGVTTTTISAFNSTTTSTGSSNTSAGYYYGGTVGGQGGGSTGGSSGGGSSTGGTVGGSSTGGTVGGTTGGTTGTTGTTTGGGTGGTTGGTTGTTGTTTGGTTGTTTGGTTGSTTGGTTGSTTGSTTGGTTGGGTCDQGTEGTPPNCTDKSTEVKGDGFTAVRSYQDSIAQFQTTIGASDIAQSIGVLSSGWPSGGTCPTPVIDIPYLKTSYTLSAQCTILDAHYSEIHSASFVAWCLAAVILFFMA